MNENVYIVHTKLPHKTLRVHSARYTQCIHERGAARDRDRERERVLISLTVSVDVKQH